VGQLLKFARALRPLATRQPPGNPRDIATRCPISFFPVEPWEGASLVEPCCDVMAHFNTRALNFATKLINDGGGGPGGGGPPGAVWPLTRTSLWGVI
jgi:hypothetical protein